MGLLTHSSIGIALRLILRARLNLIRLALIRNPWSFGEGVSRPLYRYLYLHLLFQPLQQELFSYIQQNWNAPLPTIYIVPWLRYTTYARVFSMPGHSTSELLRTL